MQAAIQYATQNCLIKSLCRPNRSKPVWPTNTIHHDDAGSGCFGGVHADNSILDYQATGGRDAECGGSTKIRFRIRLPASYIISADSGLKHRVQTTGSQHEIGFVTTRSGNKRHTNTTLEQ